MKNMLLIIGIVLTSTVAHAQQRVYVVPYGYYVPAPQYYQVPAPQYYAPAPVPVQPSNYGNYGVLPPRAPETINPIQPPVAALPPVRPPVLIPQAPAYIAPVVPPTEGSLPANPKLDDMDTTELAEGKPCLNGKITPSTPMAPLAKGQDPMTGWHHIEELPDGRKAAYDKECRLLGWYDSTTDKITPVRRGSQKDNKADLNKDQPPSMGFLPNNPPPPVDRSAEVEPPPLAAPRNPVQMKKLVYQING